jgi:antitoxin PrlF
MRVEARITSKNQLTLPREVRRALSVGDGDRLEFAIEGDAITVRKAGTRGDDPFGAFQEWSSDADQTAYDKL